MLDYYAACYVIFKLIILDVFKHLVGWVEQRETQQFIARNRWVDKANPTLLII